MWTVLLTSVMLTTQTPAAQAEPHAHETPAPQATAAPAPVRDENLPPPEQQLGLYGGDDARVGATVGPAEAEMKKLGKSYETHTYEGAGHGFLRAQGDRDGANLKAAQQAWPRTVAGAMLKFYRLGSGPKPGEMGPL